MNNMINSKLLELLSGVDQSKLSTLSNLIGSMSKEDLNSLVGMLGNQMPVAQNRGDNNTPENNSSNNN